MHKRPYSKLEMSLQGSAAKKSIGVQYDKTLECKTGDILSDTFMKQVEVIVKRMVEEGLNKLHIYTTTLDASQFELVVKKCLENILKKKKNQNLSEKRSDDSISLLNKKAGLEVQEKPSQSPVVLANSVSPFKDLSSAPIISQIDPSHDETIISPTSIECIESVKSNISSIHIMPSEDELQSNDPSISETNILSQTTAVKGPTQDKSLSKNISLLESKNVLLPSWTTLSHSQQIIVSALKYHMNKTSSDVPPSLQSLFKSEYDHQNRTHNFTHWYVINFIKN